MAKPITFTYKGREYTARQFAEMRAVTTSTIHKARRDGRLDTVGLVKDLPVYWRGEWYNSMASAARCTGVSKQYVSKWFKQQETLLEVGNN